MSVVIKAAAVLLHVRAITSQLFSTRATSADDARRHALTMTGRLLAQPLPTRVSHLVARLGR